MVSSQKIVSIWYTFVHGTILTLICSCCTPNELVSSNLPCIKLLELHPHKSIPRGASTLSYRGSEIQCTYGIIWSRTHLLKYRKVVSFGVRFFPIVFKNIIHVLTLSLTCLTFGLVFSFQISFSVTCFA